ncbi:hypothetical protein KQX54_017160 [Cotesia glomerata]|uniref:Uncharacterized protein n=1 Tax=Cotesia glomerata TaxID=32391 RepID=A0AAV7I8W3_COTGL|nr:hypothetical protein KQX54_017160 [Cotesia glomerata]
MPIRIHTILCLVPREWLRFDMDSLEILVSKVIAEHDQTSKKYITYSVRIEGISSRLRYHNGHPWMQRVDDDDRAPKLTEYYGFFVPYPHCTEFMWFKTLHQRVHQRVQRVHQRDLFKLYNDELLEQSHHA